jgi:hypothetical protein
MLYLINNKKQKQEHDKNSKTIFRGPVGKTNP